MAFFAPSTGSFFGQTSSAPRGNGNLSGLFRLVDDFDNYSKTQQRSGAGAGAGNAHPQPRAVVPSFSPRFDVRETEDAFELHGELPGAEKENVHVEFTDAQTIAVSGKVERVYHDAKAPKSLTEESHDDDDGASATSSKRNSFQPTVEDDVDDDASSGAHTPATTTVAKTTTINKPATPAAPQPKYWVLERNVGEFRRTFNLPARIDPDGVRASLNNGILAVTVPKAKKHESRRIAIN